MVSARIIGLLIKTSCTENTIGHNIFGFSQNKAKSEGRPCKNFSIKQGFYFRAGQSKQPTSVGLLTATKLCQGLCAKKQRETLAFYFACCFQDGGLCKWSLCLTRNELL
jgi:hypothetical protein